MPLRRQSERLIIVLRWVWLAAIGLVLDDSRGLLPLALIPGVGFLYNLAALLISSQPGRFRRHGLFTAYLTRALDVGLVAMVPYGTDLIGWATHALYLFPVLATGFVLPWPSGPIVALVASGLSSSVSIIFGDGDSPLGLAADNMAKALVLVLGALIAEFLRKQSHRERDMQRSLDRLTALYQLGSSLGRAREPRVFLDLLSELAIQYAGARQCSAVFTSPGAGRVGITASRAGAAILKTPWPRCQDRRADAGGCVRKPAGNPQSGPQVHIMGGDGQDEIRIEAPLMGEAGSAGTLELALVDLEEALSDTDRRALSIFATQATTALENASLVAQLERAAETDSLTGLLNKRSLFEQLNLALQRAREQGTTVSVIMLDLDDFKAFNDQYGHLAGDNALSAVAEVLRKNTRADDIRCRFGGDEFLLLLPLCERDNAANIADAVRRDAAILRLTVGGARVEGLGLSIGIASFPADATDSAELLHHADSALLRDKRSRRQRVETRPGVASPHADGSAEGGAA